MKPKGNPNPSANREQDDFPGYPHYGKQEDIYSNEQELQNIDPERPDRKKTPNVPPDEPIKSEMPGEFIEGGNQPGSQVPPSNTADDDDLDEDDEEDDDLDDEDFDDDDIDEDADITDEDRMVLNDDPIDANERMASQGRDAAGELDVPGAELDDAQEEIGSEDEENNYYSLGGDNHDDDSREPDTYSGR